MAATSPSSWRRLLFQEPCSPRSSGRSTACGRPIGRRDGPRPRSTRPPDARALCHECRGVPLGHEIVAAPAHNRRISLTKPREPYAMSRSRPQSPTTVECATIFGQQEVVSGESRFRRNPGGENRAGNRLGRPGLPRDFRARRDVSRSSHGVLRRRDLSGPRSALNKVEGFSPASWPGGGDDMEDG